MRILIADDAKLNQILVTKALEEYGELVIVENGLEALIEFRNALKLGIPFDLICLDIEMPNLNGIETLLAIRKIEENKNIKKSIIFMITGSKDITRILDSFEGKANAFIVKDSNMKNRIDTELKNHGFVFTT